MCKLATPLYKGAQQQLHSASRPTLLSKGPKKGLLWSNDEYVLLPCFNAQPDIFAIMNTYVVTLNVYSSDIPTWSTDGLYSMP